MRRALSLSLVVAALLVLVGCGGDSASGPTTTTAATATTVANPAAEPVQRDILATDVDPPGAPGRTLTLIRYTIAPGAQLAAHVHPGVQMASIQSGSLAYTVISGTAVVKRAPSGAVEEVTGPAATTLGPGDAVTETGEMVHFGANMTAEPVVILASLLTETGRDLAVPVTTVPTTTVPTSTPG